MKKRNDYEKVIIDIVALEKSDVITTSGGESMDTGSDNMSGGTWTPIEW